MHSLRIARESLRIVAESLIILAASGAVGYGQASDVLDQPARQAEMFLEALSEKSIEAPFETLLENSPLARNQEAKKIVNDTKGLFADSAHGAPAKSPDGPIERITAQRIGKDLAVLRYLYKFEHLPVVWHFSFYRTGGKWVLVGVRFDHDYEALAH